MSESANLASLDALLRFTAAVVEFQAEAQMCLTAFDAQLRQVQSWLEHDRPAFWKREIENGIRAVEEARVRLHQCRMRRVGDFRPSCFEEQKALEQAKRWLEFSQSQIPRVKRWRIAAQQEANEFHGRAGGTVQTLQRELPRLLALLRHAAETIDAYAAMDPPQRSAAAAGLTQLARDLQASLSGVAPPEASESLRSEAGEPALATPEPVPAAPESAPAAPGSAPAAPESALTEKVAETGGTAP